MYLYTHCFWSFCIVIILNNALKTGDILTIFIQFDEYPGKISPQIFLYRQQNRPGRVAQSVTCLATDACLTADPGVASSIPARYHTFVEIDHEIISTVIPLPSADLFKKGCCQLQAKVCAQITG